MRFYGWMRLRLLVEEIYVYRLRVRQKKNGTQLVLSKDTKERKDGYFGAVFTDIYRDQAYFGRRIRGR